MICLLQLSMMSAMGLWWRVFIIEICSPIPILLIFFIMDRCWILSIDFSAFLEMIRWLLFYFFCVLFHIDLQIWNHILISGINPTWSKCMILFMYYWIQYANISLRIYIYIFFLFCGVFLYHFDFCVKVIVASENKLGSILFNILE